MALLTLRGTPFLYYGDELGMAEVDVPRERLRDPVGVRRWPQDPGRDRMRTPMQWSAADGAGFTEPGVEPWLPLGDHGTRNVESQRNDPGSILSFTRELIALRRRLSELQTGTYAQLTAPEDVWAWRRGEGITVALNLSDRETRVQGVGGTVAASSPGGREGEPVQAEISLRGWEGVVIENASP
jgi:alpha-glucosidase